ncbi:unnamed protein product [Ectocarpus sp. 12 AP-2014]
MKLFFVATALFGHIASSSAAACGTICTDYAYQTGDLAVCSSADKAHI